LKAGQWLPAKAKECNTVEDALIVNGENAGQRRLVCCNGACKVHKHHLQKPAEPGATSAKRDADGEKRVLEEKINDRILVHVLQAAQKKTKADAKTFRLLVSVFTDGYGYNGSWDTVAEALQVKFTPDDHEENSRKALLAYAEKANAAELLDLLSVLILGSDLTIYAPELKVTAKFAGVDVAKLRKQLEKEAKKEEAKAVSASRPKAKAAPAK